MKLKVYLIVILSLIMVSGCATQGVNTYKYTQPTTYQIKNEIVVNKPYSQLWDEMVKEISKSFFVINNIDKESRIINLSFNTNNPESYIDCGRTHRTFTQGDKKTTFDYEVAGSAKFKYARDDRPGYAWSTYGIVNRVGSLDGRANIYIAPDNNDNKKTIVTVNTRYIWTSKVSITMFNEHFSGNTFPVGNVIEKSNTLSFNTKTTAEMDTGAGDKVLCLSKGSLEIEILKLVNK